MNDMLQKLQIQSLPLNNTRIDHIKALINTNSLKGILITTTYIF